MTMQDNIDQNVVWPITGDGVIAVLEQINDPHVARFLTDRS